MAETPNYIQLADRLQGSSLADIQGGSEFTLAGRQVKEYPKDQAGQRYVRRQMALGNIEAASKAEFDEYSELQEALVDANGDPSKIAFQEGNFQRALKQAARERDEKRESRRASTPEPAGNEGDENGDGLEDKNVEELKAQAKDLDLPVSGTKDELIERIRAKQAETSQ